MAWDDATCVVAVATGNLEIIQWLHAQGCPFNRYASCAAASHGHLQVI